MPQYKTQFDIGTYTGNGGQYRVGIPTLRSVGPTGSQIAGSLRFRGPTNVYLTRTLSSFGGKTYTFSAWVKKSNVSNVYNGLIADGAATNTTGFTFYNNNLYYTMGGGNQNTSTLKVSDASVWNHVVLRVDTTQATAANRIRFYYNGSQVTSFSLTQTPTQNAVLWGTSTFNLGCIQAGSYCLEGYMSQVYFIDGTSYDASYFGELNSDGIWVPKIATGLTYGTNGFYLPMNSSSNYATDQSGNGNNLTPVGFNVTTANTTYDIMTDSPTDYLSGSMTTANNAGNYAILNASDTYVTAGSWSITNAGQYLTSSATLGRVRGTLGFSSGKWYWEVKYINGNSSEIAGIITPTGTYVSGSGGIGYYTNGNIYVNGSASAYGTSVTGGDIIGIAVDMDNGKIWFSRNGTWQNSGDPAAGTNPGTTGISGTYYPGFEDGATGTNATYDVNFGQRAFTYTPPTGFKALNTYNYPRPADSSMWFYGSTPDLMWIKNRSTTANHSLTDTLRGPGLSLASSSLSSDLGDSDVSEMNKFGMSLIGASSRTNGSTNNFVYWGWKGGGPAVSGTGNLTNVMVSTNPTAGFSVVTYTGNGVVNAQFGHGLGVTPSMTIIKNRSSSSEHWNVWHTSLASQQYYLFLETTDSVYTVNNSRIQSLTSSVVTIGSNSELNASGSLYVAYCWAAIPGYSAFGSYTGNGSSDGPFVYTGFRPKWIMWKRTDTIGSWFISDAVRQTYNVMGTEVYAESTAAEATSNRLDFVSNGFKLRAANSGDNASSGTYVYAAFAEIPFKYARAR